MLSKRCCELWLISVWIPCRLVSTTPYKNMVGCNERKTVVEKKMNVYSPCLNCNKMNLIIWMHFPHTMLHWINFYSGIFKKRHIWNNHYVEEGTLRSNILKLNWISISLSNDNHFVNEHQILQELFSFSCSLKEIEGSLFSKI